MARGAKVKSRNAYFQTSSEDDSDCESKPSYKTLAKIATEQQKAMEHIQKLLDKSDDPLDAEMTRSQSIIEDIKNLHVKYEELESRHETLSTTHEKLSCDYAFCTLCLSSFHHDDHACVLLCLLLSTYSAASSSSLRNFLTRKFLSEEFIKIAYSPPSSRYNALSRTRDRILLVFWRALFIREDCVHGDGKDLVSMSVDFQQRYEMEFPAALRMRFFAGTPRRLIAGR